MKKILTAVAAFLACSAFAAGPYDGIYQWSQGYFLSLHQNGSTMIGTVYWVASQTNPVGFGALMVSDVDTFDLFNGPISGNKAMLTGTRIFRACDESYDLVFNADSTITATHTSGRNASSIDPALYDCAKNFNAVGSVWKLPKLW
jgi:hypothetical protein